MADIPRFEIPPQMRALAETSIGQARTAFDGLLGMARRGAETMRHAGGAAAPGADMYARGLDHAEQNMHAAFDHAQRLARAGSVQEAMELHIQYVQSQFAVLQEQAKAFGGLAQSAMQRGADRAGSSMREGSEQAVRMMERARDTGP